MFSPAPERRWTSHGIDCGTADLVVCSWVILEITGINHGLGRHDRPWAAGIRHDRLWAAGIFGAFTRKLAGAIASAAQASMRPLVLENPSQT